MNKQWTNMIQLTISIAAYNVEEYISRTLKSCIVSEDKQKYIEIIIVNDGSTDNTLNIALEYQKRYPGLFRIVDKQNGGYGSTINCSLNEARGRYFRLLDGDDWYDTEALEIFIDKLLKCDADVVFTNYVAVNEDDTVKSKGKYGEEEKEKLYKINEDTSIIWSMHKMAVKTELLIENNVKISEKCFYTDMEYVFNIIKYMDTYICFDITLYHYLVGRNGQSMSRAGMIKNKEDAKQVLEKEAVIFNTVTNCAKKNIMKKWMCIHAWHVINSYLLCGSNQQNKNELIELDMKIKNELPEIYELTNQKIVYKLMRKLHYRFYDAFRWNALRKFK